MADTKSMILVVLMVTCIVSGMENKGHLRSSDHNFSAAGKSTTKPVFICGFVILLRTKAASRKERISWVLRTRSDSSGLALVYLSWKKKKNPHERTWDTFSRMT